MATDVLSDARSLFAACGMRPSDEEIDSLIGSATFAHVLTDSLGTRWSKLASHVSPRSLEGETVLPNHVQAANDGLI